jgi:hypothetical protein
LVLAAELTDGIRAVVILAGAGVERTDAGIEARPRQYRLDEISIAA